MLLLICQHTKAQILGADITYQHTSGTQYDFTLTIYRDCDNEQIVKNQEIIDAQSVNCDQKFPVAVTRDASLSGDVSPACEARDNTCEGGDAIGIFKEVYTGSVDLGTRCNDWSFTWLECTDTEVLDNVEYEDEECVFVEATLNNEEAPGNSSPQFGREAFAYNIVGNDARYNPQVTDTDGDNLEYELVTPRIRSEETVTFLPPYSAETPVSSSTPVAFDNNTGILSYNLDQPQRAVAAIRVNEYQNGVLVGSTVRTFQIIGEESDNNNPVLSGFDDTEQYEIDVCAGQELDLRIYGSDPDEQDSLWMEWDEGIENAEFEVINDGTNSPFGVFSWTPNNSDEGTHVMRVTVQDDNCPVRGAQTLEYTINVYQQPVVLLTKVDTAIPCGETTPVEARAIFGESPYTFNWSNGASGDSVNFPIGSYSVTVTDNSPPGCSSTNDFTIEGGIEADFEIDSLCHGSATQFNDQSETELGTINSWEWDFGDGDGSDIQNPQHSYDAPGDYTVSLEVEDDEGCAGTINKTITICDQPEADFEYLDSCQFHPIGNQQTVNFVSNSTSDLCEISSWEWDFGDGTSTTNFNSYPSMEHAYAQTGTYDVTLTVANSEGCEDQITKSLEIYPHPDVELQQNGYTHNCSSPDSSLVAVGHANPLESEKTYTYQWNTGQSRFIGQDILDETEEATSDTIVAGSIGMKQVTVVDEYGCFYYDNLIVEDPITSDFTKDAYCEENDTVSFVNQSASEWGIDTLEWDLGDGSPLQYGSPIDYLYPEEGVYNVSLRIVDSSGCVHEVSQQHINVLPEDTFSISNDTLCYGQPLAYYSPEGSYVNSWNWQFQNDGTVFQERITDPNRREGVISFQEQYGDFETSLTVNYNNNQCTRIYDTVFHINEPLIPEVSIDNYCSDAVTNFEAQKISGEYPVTDWQWYFDYRFDSTSAFERIDSAATRNSQKQFEETGQIRARLQMEDGYGCTSVHDSLFWFYNVPDLSFGVNGNCLNEPVQLVRGDFNDRGIINYFTYTFERDNVELQNSTGSTFHRFNQVGENPVTFKAFAIIPGNKDTCTSQVSDSIEIEPVPQADFPERNICVNEEVNFDATSSTPASDSSSITGYNWLFHDSTQAGGTHVTHVYEDSGSYQVQLVVSDENTCTDTITKTVSVKDLPEADFDFGENNVMGEAVEFTDQSIDAVEWHWAFGDGDSTSVMNAADGDVIHTYDEVNEFPVSLRVLNEYGCADSVMKHVDLRPHLVLPNAFSPNEDNVNDELYLMHDKIKSLKFFRIYNRWGELIFEANGDLSASWDGTYKGSPQPIGTYVVYASAVSIYNTELSIKTKVTLVR